MRAFLFNAARRYRPSMRRDFDHEKLWSDACRLAVEDLRDDGHAVPPLPLECPFELEKLVGGEADPRNLAAQLATAVAALGRNDGAQA